MYVITIDHDNCEACEECVEICATEVLAMVEENGKKYAMVKGDPDDCLGCLSCEEVCEEGAITVTEL
jgi:NAD-dependent dihydropyrimidine dehydrogenase PreA subunit